MPHPHRATLLALTLTGSLAARAAHGQTAANAPAAAPAPHTPLRVPRAALRYDLRADLPVTLSGVGFTLVTELGKPLFVGPSCRWCDRDPTGASALNPFDAAVRGLRWSDLRLADTLSNVTGYALTPLFGLGGVALLAGLNGQLGNVPLDLLLVAEATAVTATLVQIVKFSAMRERPFVHALTEGARAMTDHPEDNNLSFFSGHSAITFSLAVSAGTVATMRGYRFAPLVWATGLSAAAATAFLRIAADKHYATDVLLGTAVGVGLGFAIPYLFHRPLGFAELGLARGASPRVRAVSVLPLPQGAGLALDLDL